jgi:hypothetical protein
VFLVKKPSTLIFQPLYGLESGKNQTTHRLPHQAMFLLICFSKRIGVGDMMQKNNSPSAQALTKWPRRAGLTYQAQQHLAFSFFLF